MSIVGGAEAYENSVPWQVSIKSNDYNHFCGGSLVRGKSGIAVVTAAHCVSDGTQASSIQVVVGRHSLSTQSASEKTYQVSEIKNHPQYNSSNMSNDIAVLFVEGEISETDEVAPIQLPNKQSSVFNGQECLISGWGALKEGEEGPDKLQEAWVDLFSNAVCYDRYNEDFNRDLMICGGKEAGGVDSCQGDSGGPFACFDEEWNPILVGVTSWGEGCARADKPGVYADVFKLRSWLNSVLGL
ncbi:Plasminogen,Anionic trypsin-1,Trypsin,Enteropeptidase,Transmembrane protease serine 9,Anionic trypsin,Plasma kallikrein,Trypsin II-P29 [Mytilus coruscus]|uniref:Plasminogen,Anionic trypsin-1,Trypsin,Enteropeptidase,Transmembrane protease serine 9,Anionic trypsin,Plasma kallikrein,Trypsin II-P29 n=1 Tax=Mytilus coruscus TaxID=42192 RepID=A0A6J8CNZ5_MYTCO|nr:Plasminogen,Anionic trypsin-1,Trypsin,Enteropeptidase,Transmembrane protease serine 9,Anionic trypsin,Plasma kallikrein,Trypsin II-P29 [Mytilus coruscus]